MRSLEREGAIHPELFQPARMGWGVIEMSGTRLSHIAHGVIATKPSSGLGVRLMLLHRELSVVIESHAPRAIAVEQAFVARDPQAAVAAMLHHLSASHARWTAESTPASAE